MKPLVEFKTALRYLAHDLFPTPCAVCEEFSPEVHHHLCTNCYFRLTQQAPFYGPLCKTCGISGLVPPEEICESCRKTEKPFLSLRTVAIYSGLLQKAILAFKYSGFRDLAKPLARMYLSAPSPPWLWHEISGLIPVPMHRSRFLERGFDHTLLLAQCLQREAKRNLGVKIPIYSHLLRVKKEIAHQAGASRKSRSRNLRKALMVDQKFKDSQITPVFLLLDDVYTTGATLQYCAQALQQAFSQASIHALTLARTSLIPVKDESKANL